MADTIAALQRQGGAYTLETVSPQGERKLEKITSITEVIAYEPTLARVLELGADPATRIVSFTVTEAGYALDHQGELDLKHPEVVSDLAGTTKLTIYGVVSRHPARAPRRERGRADVHELRQPAPQRRPLPQEPAPLPRGRRRRRHCSPGWTRTRPAPTRWSTASRRAPRPT
jgi:hypothetical protein